MKKAFIILIALLLVLPLVLATDPFPKIEPHKKNDCFNLIQQCDNGCSSVNMTAVFYPNGTINALNITMNRLSNLFYYNYCATDAVGNYVVTGIGNPNNVLTSWNYNFQITKSGDAPISGNMNIFLWAIFIISLVGIILTMIYVIMKVVVWDVNLNNLLASWGFFILFFIVNYLSQDSFNSLIFRVTDTFIYWFGFTNVVIPGFAFMASVFYKSVTGKGKIV